VLIYDRFSPGNNRKQNGVEFGGKHPDVGSTFRLIKNNQALVSSAPAVPPEKYKLGFHPM
jgi:hypothetical protein